MLFTLNSFKLRRLRVFGNRTLEKLVHTSILEHAMQMDNFHFFKILDISLLQLAFEQTSGIKATEFDFSHQSIYSSL